MSSLNYDIDTNAGALRQIAQIVRNYSNSQCELIRNYLNAMSELEGDIETEGYQQRINEILQFSRQMELLKLSGLAFAVFLMDRADLLETQQNVSGSFTSSALPSYTGRYTSIPYSAAPMSVGSAYAYPPTSYPGTGGHTPSPSAAAYGPHTPVTSREVTARANVPQQTPPVSDRGIPGENPAKNGFVTAQDIGIHHGLHPPDVGSSPVGTDVSLSGEAREAALCPNRYSETRQSFAVGYSPDGRAVSIFDHPQESVKTAVFGQGACFVDGKRYGGTCGLCALATILSRAGVDAQEQSVLEEAVCRGLCDDFDEDQNGNRTWEDRGATSAWDRERLAQCFGMDMEVQYEEPLEALAKKVEEGYGVIIAVMAGDGMYNPYHMYDGIRGGHALVLNSVERDAITGEIIAYYVIDSNGQNPESAGIRIPADDLNEAYEYRGRVANVTSDIIW